MTTTTTKQELLAAAITVAKRVGVNNVTRHLVADEAKVSDTLIPYHFGLIDDLRRAILREGYDKGHINIILQGVTANDKAAWRALKKHTKETLHFLFGL